MGPLIKIHRIDRGELLLDQPFGPTICSSRSECADQENHCSELFPQVRAPGVSTITAPGCV
jgi:hypothetical protein